MVIDFDEPLVRLKTLREQVYDLEAEARRLEDELLRIGMDAVSAMRDLRRRIDFAKQEARRLKELDRIHRGNCDEREADPIQY